MKKGDHKGLGGNSRRTERKRNRYAASLERRDRMLTNRIAVVDDAVKAAKNHDQVDDLAAQRAALVVRRRKVERLAAGCTVKPSSVFAAMPTGGDR